MPTSGPRSRKRSTSWRGDEVISRNLSFVLVRRGEKRVVEVVGRDARIRALASELLKGVAQSQHEADLALQKLHGVKGVRTLKPHLRIVAAKK